MSIGAKEEALVVICFQISIFEPLETTRLDKFMSVYML